MYTAMIIIAIWFVAGFAAAGVYETDNLKVGHKITFADVAYSANLLAAHEAVSFGNALFMACSNASVAGTPYQLWTWNGNLDAASIQQANGATYTEVSSLTVVNNALYFVAKVSGSLTLVKVTGTAPSFAYASIFNNDGGSLTLHGYTGTYDKSLVADGSKLYLYCKNTAGAVVLREYDTSNNSWNNRATYAGKDNMILLGAAGGNVYYTVRDASGEGSLYVYDGGSDYTVASSVMKNPQYMQILNHTAYFGAIKKADNIRRLWRSNGSDAGTVEIPIDNDLGYDGNFRMMVVSRNQLFLPVKKNFEDGGVTHYLYVAHLNDQGVVTPNTFRIVKNISATVGGEAHWLDVVGNSLFFHVHNDSTHLGYFQSDGTDPGTVKISNDTQKSLTTTGILNNKVLVNDLGSNKRFKVMQIPNLGDTGVTDSWPTNLRWSGLRASAYGIMSLGGNPPFAGDPMANAGLAAYGFPEPWRWEAAAKACIGYSPAGNTQPTLLWIVTRPRVDLAQGTGGCVVQMKKPAGITVDSKIQFCDDPALSPSGKYNQNLHDRSEAFLDHFDRTGVKVWIQVEPGFANMDDNGTAKGLMSVIVDYLVRQDQNPANPIHPCVIGIGVDVEWVRNNREGSPENQMGSIHPSNPLNNGYAVVEAVAQWYKKCKDNNLGMYLKHYAFSLDGHYFICDYSDLSAKIDALGSAYTGGIQNIQFVNDSQGFRYPWGEPAPGPGPVDENGNTIAPATAYTNMMNDFKGWVDKCQTGSYKSPVGFQVAYPNDWVTRSDGFPGNNGCGWLNFMDMDTTDETWKDDAAPWDSIQEKERWKIIPKLQLKLAQKFSDRNIGVYFVDFRSRLLFANQLFDWREPRAAAAVNKVVNGTFNSSLSSWSFYCDTAAEATAYVQSGKARVDTTNAGSETWHVHLRQDNIALENGHTYYLQFDAKAVECPRTLFCQMEKNGDDYANYSGPRTFYLSQSMQTFSHIFTMNHASDNAASLCFEFGLEPIDVILDNVRLVEITEETNVTAWEPYRWYEVGAQVTHNGFRYICTNREYSLYGREPNNPVMWSVWKKI